MGKRIVFEYPDNQVICYAYDKSYVGKGVASYKEDSIEDHPNKLVGESIAYSKAKRSIVKQKISDKKKELETLNNFIVYLFPQRFQGRYVEWMRERAQKRIKALTRAIEHLEFEKKEIDESIEDYLKERAGFIKRLQRKRKETV